MKRKSKTGFTLTELMLAMAIFAIAIIGIYSMYNASVALIDMAGTLTQMINAADFKLESLYDVADFASLDNYNSQSFNLPEFGFNSIAVSGATGVYIITPLNDDLKRATVVISYKIKGNRIIGEDANLNGLLDAGEDLNGDSRLSSPVELSTIIARRQG